MHDALGLIVDHFDHHFDKCLETARHAGSGLACCHVHEQATNHTQQTRTRKCVSMLMIEKSTILSWCFVEKWPR